MIPKNITYENILRSIGRIDHHGIPNYRQSVKWSLEKDGKFYPPKYAVSIAYKSETAKELLSEKFSGGPETNKFLTSLGFNIVKKGTRLVKYPLESDLWKAVSDKDTIKILEKSSFLHHGSVVPRDFKIFFDLDEFQPGQRKNVTLIHQNNIYFAHFEIYEPLKRLMLFWRSDFSDWLKDSFPQFNKD